MNKIKRIACAVLAGILLCGALAFAAQTRGQEMRDAPIRTIELEVENPVLVEMKIGEQVQLVLADTAADSDTGSQGSGTQQPSEGTWNSEQPDIVSVDENGLLTAKAEGTAVISKSVPQGVVSCEVTVKGYQVTGLELTAETEMRVGQTQTVRADITPTEAQATLTWSSDNTDVVTVNANGDVTAVGTGRATIAAETEDGLQAFLVITVEGYVIESLSIEPSAIDLYVGDSQAITVQAKPEGSDPGELTWKFSDASIAYYRDGNIYAASAGEATITATNADGVQAQCNVTVHNTSLSLNQTTATLQAGKTVQLQATVTPAGRTVEWSSDNAAVARVDQNGVVTGVKAGTAKITAKINGAEAVCQVTVTETSSNNPSNPSNPSTPSNPSGSATPSNGSNISGIRWPTTSIGNVSASGGVLYLPGSITRLDSLYTMPEHIPSSVYLTVDSGLDVYTESVLNQLATNSMHATFFVPIDNLYQADDMLRHIAGNGNSLGFLLTPEQAADGSAAMELLAQANEQLSVITGTPTHLVRIAGGSSGNITSETAAALIAGGYRLWDWNTDAREDTMTADTCYQALSGAIDTTAAVTIRFQGGANTASVLQQLLPYMKYCGIPAEEITAADTAVCNTAVG